MLQHVTADGKKPRSCSCGVIDITLTDNMKARGCEIVEADQSLSYPDCCGPTLVCPPETTTPTPAVETPSTKKDNHFRNKFWRNFIRKVKDSLRKQPYLSDRDSS